MSDALPGTGRIEAFSDGVIAIILTIMVLDLKLPEHAAELGLRHGIIEPLTPKLVPYVMSYLVIAIMWVNHHHLLHLARHASGALFWCNNNLLFWMSFIPVSTAFLGENPLVPLSVAAYGLVLAANTWAFVLLRWCITRDASGRVVPDQVAAFRKSISGATLYTASVPLAFVTVYLSIAIFVAIPAAFLLPDLLIRRRRARAAARRRR